jgi:hypothetical protein
MKPSINTPGYCLNKQKRMKYALNMNSDTQQNISPDLKSSPTFSTEVETSDLSSLLAEAKEGLRGVRAAMARRETHAK